MWQSHQLFGKLEWTELFQPIIKICEEGYNTSKANAAAIDEQQKYVRDPTFNLW